MRLPFSNKTERDRELLNEYLDNRLSAEQAARLEARLRDDGPLRAELAELRRVRDVLRAQPSVEPRRSFAITPQMAGPHARPTRQRAESPFTARALQLATAATAVLLAAVIGVDVIAGPAPVAGPLDATIRSAEQGTEAPPVNDVGALAPSSADAPPLDDGDAARSKAMPVSEERSDTLAIEAAPAPDSDDRSLLRWTELGLGIVTAALALAVVAATWRAASRG
ncbi:MAG: hypothetical protein FJ318_00235 [SAR202 cluster bacterium]|nr:hypothetical protein [SAR202 cluster bacterium]